MYLSCVMQGCSLGLDVSVSRPFFEMSRSRLVNFIGTSHLGFKVKCLGLGHEGLVYSEHCAKCLVSASDIRCSLMQPINHPFNLTEGQRHQRHARQHQQHLQ